ncbi:hypothetical protein [Mycolicibacterium brumae]|uniref:GNAT family N-acetyltransferase n=1 Tax=Mycolicibacterium brumae TaxID=85968 RepID=A0A2G5PE23_9MYCO|nr:hypothetical protein [Mycolicibacterium brumae]MCV7192679.1 GNAT family N-acetyltransferase [Mycolicibacterium brumae]PIB76578.1 GNAT family N-acetyltransferase [Mycolicibacterium brumae]RWA23263.1 hypothetical protein MBRU_00155 [Mycolicibacterium brumae DSM 44177]UWW08807.1 GNAT family N-acetyltransferase [Mycolicibacterium brumae]
MGNERGSAAGAPSTEAALQRAAVTMRELHTGDECVAGAALLAGIWGTAHEAAPLQADVLLALGHAGGCVLGAYSGDELIGLTVGIAGAPNTPELYSLIAGVAGSAAGRGVGVALKLAQRDWAIEHGATRMRWTYDPLIRRNAHFNLNRLGAHIDEFVPDFYPPMTDAVNAGDLTDRFVVVWDFADPRPSVTAPPEATVVLAAGPDLEPLLRPAAPGPWLVQTPPDIEAVRRSDPARSHQWRLGVRAVMQDAQRDGYRVMGFVDGSYLLGRD